MSSAGPTLAGTGASFTPGWSVAVSWSNTGNVTASDNSRASVLYGTSTGFSDYLVGKNYGFSIPSSARIDGIVVEIEKSLSVSATCVDKSVMLTKDAASTVGSDKASGSAWPVAGAESFVSYGSSSDLWGTTWTPAEINASTFGVCIATNKTDATGSNARVDSIRITVTYTIVGAAAIAGTGTISASGTVTPAPVVTTTRVVRHVPSLRLSLNVTPPSGSPVRWGRDEPDSQNAPASLTFSTGAPGGFEQASLTLPRRSKVRYEDLERLSTVTISGPGGEVAWEGRLESAPRDSGDNASVSPSLVGWQAHLQDDSSARMIYVDSDMSAWTGAGSQQRYTLLGTFGAVSDPSVQADTDLPALTLSLGAGEVNSVAQAWYNSAPDCNIGSIYYDLISLSDSGNVCQIGVASDDQAVATDLSADLLTGTDSSASGTHTPSVAYRYGLIGFYNVGTIGSTERQVFVRHLKVWGDHGLTKRGTAPDDGLYASDIIGHALSNYAPRLSYSTGLNGSITDSGFIIPQAVFLDPTTAADIISTVNRFHLWDWFVWEGSRPGQPTFYYHDRGARGRSWRARVGPSGLAETGPQMDRLWNGVIVSYSDVDGSTKTVGPTGAKVDAEYDTLLDDDSENPANKLGITRYQTLSMNGVSTPAGAAEVGRRFLQETKALDTSGQAQIVGYLEDDRGVRRPAWQIRAGDTIRFVDASDTSERRVVKTSYDDATKTNSIDLDAPSDGLDALLERLQVVLTPLGLG